MSKFFCWIEEVKGQETLEGPLHAETLKLNPNISKLMKWETTCKECYDSKSIWESSVQKVNYIHTQSNTKYSCIPRLIQRWLSVHKR